MSTVIVYELGNQSLRLECEPHEVQDARADLVRQGLRVWAVLTSGMGHEFKQAWKGKESGR